MEGYFFLSWLRQRHWGKHNVNNILYDKENFLIKKASYSTIIINITTFVIDLFFIYFNKFELFFGKLGANDRTNETWTNMKYQQHKKSSITINMLGSHEYSLGKLQQLVKAMVNVQDNDFFHLKFSTGYHSWPHRYIIPCPHASWLLVLKRKLV